MNPFEVEVKPQDKLELIINQVEQLELEIKEKKKIEDKLKEIKQSLVDEIEKRELLKFNWVTPNNTKFTYVAATEPKEEKKMIFAEERFKKEHPDLYQEYLWECSDVKGARKSYVRVTLPKE